MKLIKRVMVFSVMLIFLMSPMVHQAYAIDIEDNLSPQNSASSEDFFGSIKDQDIGDAANIGDILGSQQTMTSEHLEYANKWASPLTNFIGYACGVIVTLIVVATGLLTVLDIMYISVPFVRNLLYKSGTDGTGAYNNGIGMGASGGTAKPTQWVSDEAVACAAMLGGSRQSAGMGMNAGMPMNMGMGMGQPQEPKPIKSVIGMYVKKRSVFLVMLAVAIVVLTSSALFGTGVNLAQWLLRVIMVFNGKMG